MAFIELETTRPSITRITWYTAEETTAGTSMHGMDRDTIGVAMPGTADMAGVVSMAGTDGAVIMGGTMAITTVTVVVTAIAMATATAAGTAMSAGMAAVVTAVGTAVITSRYASDTGVDRGRLSPLIYGCGRDVPATLGGRTG